MADKTIPALKILRGNVGINTATPAFKIDVHGSAVFRGAASWAGNDNQTCAIYLNNTGRGLYGNFANYARNLVKASSQYVEVGQNSTLVYGVKFIVGSNAPNGFMFQSNIGGTMTTHMNIRGDTGNVGIGTNAPDSLLMVYKSGADSIIHVRGASNGGDARVRINGYNSSELYLDRNGAGRFAFRRTTGTDDLSLLKLNDNYTDNSTIMFWDYSSGSVGIGTNAPGDVLHVDGNTIIGDTDRQSVVLTLKAQNTAGAPAATTKLVMQGYEGRGIGTFYEDSSYSGEQWFCGMNYSGGFNSWNVGYDASGDQAEYVANTLLQLHYTGKLQLHAYGSGTHTGTAAYKLAVDSSGNVIETAIGAGQVDGSGTANKVTKWTDTDTIGDSQITDNGTSVGINQGSPNAANRLEVSGTVTCSSQLISAQGYTQPPVGTLTIQGPTNGGTTINSDVWGLVVGPQHTRSSTANTYYAGIAFNHLLNHNGSATYNNAPQAWIGTRLHDTSGSERGFLVFATKSGTGTSSSDVPIERMCIDPVYGSIGIGTTDPDSQMQIGRSQTTDAFNGAFIKLRPSNTTNSTGLTSITLGTSTVDNYGYSISGWRAGTDGSPYLRIQRHHNSAAGTDVMVMKNNGDAVFYGGNWYCNTNNSTNVSNGGLYINRGGGLYAYALAAARSGTGLGGVDFWDYHGVGLVFGPDSSTKVLTVKSNIGIGTTNPGYILDVRTAIQGAMQVKGAQTHGLLLGEAAYSTSALYTGLKTSYMTGVNDYMIISGTTTDGNTYISAKSGGNAHMRAGGNNSTNEVVVSASTGITYKSGVRHEFSTGNVGINTSTVNVKLAVAGQASFADRKLSLIGLDINSGGTPSYIKIRTKIPFASGSADFTVNIKGFRYVSAQMVDITVGWHYYNSTFYNPSVSSSGAFAPTVKLSAEDWDSSGTKKVCIVLVGPGYWPKLYVDSMYSSSYRDSYAAGWTWVDADATGTGNDLATLSYKSDFGNNFRMLSSGSVGIGTASPTARLNVKASGSTVDQIAVTHSGNTVEIAQLGQSANGNSAGALLLKNNSGTDKVYLDAAGSSYINGGNVGINTTSPAYKLDVYGGDARIGTNLRLGNGSAAGNSTNPAITVSAVNTAGVYFENSGVGFGAGSGSKYLFLSSAGNASLGGNGFFKQLGDRPYGTDNLNDYYRSNDEASFCQFYRYDATHGHWANSSGTLTTNAPSTLTQPTSSIYSYGALFTLRSLNSFRGQFYFAHSASEFYWRSGWGTNGDQNWTRIVGDRNIQSVINNVGNISIGGVSTNTARLHINETGTGTPIQITRANNSGNGMIKFMTGGTNDWIIGLRNVSDSDFHLYSYATASNVFSVLRADGNVGIGDDTPENKLTVNGSSRFKDTMFFAATNRGLISWGTMGGGTGFGMQAASGNGLSLGANSTWDHIVITTAGNVGIGRATAHGKLDILAADLGTSSGNVSVVSRSSSDVGSNTMYLLEEYVRTSAGSDWTSAGVRLQAKTDSTYQGYIQFNGDSNNYGITFGAGAGGTSSPGTTPEKMRIASTGNVSIGSTSSAYGRLFVDAATTAANTALAVRGRDASADYLALNVMNNADGELFSILNNGRAKFVGAGVGINKTPNSQYDLDMAGQMLVGSHMSFKAANSIQGIGFNRNVHTGGIYSSSYYAYQLHSNANNFELQRYNGSGTFLGYGLTCDGSGNIGIGTQYGSANLHVFYSSGVTDIKAGFLSGTAGPGIRGQNTSTTANTYFPIDFRVHDADARIAFQYSGTTNQGQFLFVTENNGSSQSFGIYDRGDGATRVLVNDTTSVGAPNKTFEVKYLSTSTDVTQEGLSGGGAGKGIMIYNAQASDNVYANLDFRANNADGRIAYQYKTATNVGDFHFITDNTGSPVSRMTITNDGNVGISTTDPQTDLQIGDATGNPKLLIFGASHSSASSQILFGDWSASGGPYYAGMGIRYNSNHNKLHFDDNATSTNNTIMTLDRATQTVGIGTETPSAPLHIFYEKSTAYAAIKIRNFNNASACILYEDASGNSEWATGHNYATNDWRVSQAGNSNTGLLEYPKLVVRNGGNVGIGSVFPQAKLVVNGDTYIVGNVGIGTTPNSSYKLEVNGAFAASSKSFVIDHPTKENKKLIHGSLEGPEYGVYHRGTTQSNTITLPDYWSGLVREDTITVQLTPRGGFQHLYVVSASLSQIVIGAAEDETIDCFYTIYGERADIDSLVVEKDV